MTHGTSSAIAPTTGNEAQETVEIVVVARDWTATAPEPLAPLVEVRSAHPVPDWVRPFGPPSHGAEPGMPHFEFVIARAGRSPPPGPLPPDRRFVFTDDRIGDDDLPPCIVRVRAAERDLDFVSQIFARAMGFGGAEFIGYDYRDVLAVTGADRSDDRIGGRGRAVVLDGVAVGPGRFTDETRRAVLDLRAQGYDGGIYLHALLHDAGPSFTLAAFDKFTEATLATDEWIAGAVVLAGLHPDRSAVVVTAFADDRPV